MDYLENFGDQRQTAHCVYCGGSVETREHAPPRVFLDKPYPNHLPIVPACEKCNNGFSLDEEYVACLIECAKVGGTNIELIQREKIRKILERKPSLIQKINYAMQKKKNSIFFTIEADRFKRVFMKIACCHILYQENETQMEEPFKFEMGTFPDFSKADRLLFETMPEMNKSPEVGSRSMQQIKFLKRKPYNKWVLVQPNRYRYLTDGTDCVRMVFSEYVWCKIQWK